MPDSYYGYHYRPKTWRTMQGWERKNWYRDNAAAIARGQKPLRKP